MLKQVLTWSAVLFIFCNSAFATGLSKPVNVGPKAVGMGGAFMAIADDPTAIYHNPAGITQLKGHQIEGGLDALITDEQYTPNVPPGSPEESADTEFIPVPQFGYTSDHFKPISWGLGIFFPHGNGGTFSSPSAYPVNPDEGRIYSMEISPAVAWELMKGLSVRATLRIVRVSSSLKNQIFVIPGVGTDTLTDLDVSGWGVGVGGGVLYKACSFFSFGANFRSNVTPNLSGNATFQTIGNHTASYDQPLPTMVTAGVALKPLEKLTIGIGYGFERNSELDKYVVAISGLPNQTINENWTDSHTIHVGGEYWLSSELALRAGYAKDLNDSIPDSSINRVIGDIAAHETSFGAAYKWSRYTFEGTWNGRFGSRDVPVSVTGPGHYEAFVNMLSFAVKAEI